MDTKVREEEKLGEECGVFGIYDFNGGDVASTVYYGLFALQHRGQESCGIAVSDTAGPKGKVLSVREMGLLNENFTTETLEKLRGDIGVGHVRYSTAGSSTGARMMMAGPVSMTMPRIRKMTTRTVITEKEEWKLLVIKSSTTRLARVRDSTRPKAVAKASTKARPPYVLTEEHRKGIRSLILMDLYTNRETRMA